MTEPTPAGTTRGRSTAGTIFYILLGPLLWAAHFTLIYFMQSMLCAHQAAGGGAVPAVVGGATILFLAAAGAALAAPRRAQAAMGAAGWPAAEAGFHTTLMRLLALLSAAGILWAGLAALVIPDCPALR